MFTPKAWGGLNLYEVRFCNVQSSKLPATGEIADGHTVTVIDLAVYRRLNEQERLAYRQELERIIDQQTHIPEHQREKLKRGRMEALDQADVISSGQVAQAQRFSLENILSRDFVFMDSDTFMAHVMPIGSDIKLTEQESEILKYRIFEHEKAHLLGYDEAGADYIAAVATLQRYGEDARRMIQINADRRIIDAVVLSVDPNAPKDKGYELYEANARALRDFESLQKMPGPVREEVISAKAHELDKLLFDNRNRPVSDNPEVHIKRALGWDPFPARIEGPEASGRQQSINVEALSKDARELYEESLKANRSSLSSDEDKRILQAYTDALRRSSASIEGHWQPVTSAPEQNFSRDMVARP